MSCPGRRAERAITAGVFAAFAAFWLVAFALAEPPQSPSRHLVSAVMVAVVATPWSIAARLLWRAWARQNEARWSALDGPARLLAAAAAATPAGRREWVAAMAAELEQVQGRSPRWWFAVGCAWTAVFPPRSGRFPLLAVGTLAAAAALIAGRVVDHALPAMRVFTVAFVGSVGALATLAAARSWGLRQPAPGTSIAGAAGVAACIALTAYFLNEHPEAAEHLPPRAAIVLAASLAGCLGLTLRLPRAPATSRAARASGACASLALGLGFLVTSRCTIDTYAGTLVWVILAPELVYLAGSAAAAAIARSFRAGVQAAVWTAVLGTLLVFAISLPEAMRRYAIDGRTLGDGESGYAIGVNLADAIWVIFVIPLLGLPFGVIGAAVGSWARGARTSLVAVSS